MTVIPAAALLQLLPISTALLVMAAALLLATLVVRACRVRDLLYDWWPCLGAAAILLETGALHAGPSFMLTAIAALAALTVALAPGRPVLRAWTAAPALAWGLYLGLEAAGTGAAALPLIWGGVGFAVVALGSLRRERVAGHLAIIGHAVTLGALLGSHGGWTEAGTLGLWTCGWLVAVAAHEAARSALTALAVRVVGHRARVLGMVAAFTQQVLVTSLPLLALVMGQQLASAPSTGAAASSGSWTPPSPSSTRWPPDPPSPAVRSRPFWR